MIFSWYRKKKKKYTRKRTSNSVARIQARLFIHERLTYWNQFYNFSYKRVFIKNQKTRWGSCSKNGNLNFNYKIIYLPPHLADYIIVHELCHLGEFNHSKRFWNLVEKTIPEYARCKNELRTISQNGFHQQLFRSTIKV